MAVALPPQSPPSSSSPSPTSTLLSLTDFCMCRFRMSGKNLSDILPDITLSLQNANLDATILGMEPQYDHRKYEADIYKLWEKSGAFSPSLNTGHQSPFTIIMPPPNANDPLHIGHARFVTIEDVLTRYHRMKGEPTLWLPGSDHAGIETQYVFEKNSSLYTDCHGRKFERRISPPERMMMSGSGTPDVQRFSSTSASVISSPTSF